MTKEIDRVSKGQKTDQSSKIILPVQGTYQIAVRSTTSWCSCGAIVGVGYPRYSAIEDSVIIAIDSFLFFFVVIVIVFHVRVVILFLLLWLWRRGH